MTLKQYLKENKTIEGRTIVYLKYKNKLTFRDINNLDGYIYKLTIVSITDYFGQKLVELKSCKEH